MKISVITPSIRPEGLKIVQESLEHQTFQDFEWLTELGLPKRGNDLNAAFNRMLRRAKAELIVFYQDCIKVLPDGLERFYRAYEEHPDTFFTAPVGKTMDWQTVTYDWRIDPVAFMDWSRWEIDWASAPLAALKKIGGFDEELDKHTWTFDNVNAGLRADLAGYKFACLPDNKAVAFDHDKVMKHPFRDKWNPEWHNQRLDEFRRGLTVDYLS